MIDFENNPAATPVLDVHRYVEDFAASVVPAYRRGVADEELGADAGVARSLIPPGTSATRDFSALAPRIPEFIREKCVGCMLCVSACPDTAILAVALPEAEVTDRTDVFVAAEAASAPVRASIDSHFSHTQKYAVVPE